MLLKLELSLGDIAQDTRIQLFIVILELVKYIVNKAINLHIIPLVQDW